MHALNDYYYVKGDPGDKVCFPKHIIKPATDRASIKIYIYGGYSTRGYIKFCLFKKIPIASKGLIFPVVCFW